MSSQSGNRRTAGTSTSGAARPVTSGASRQKSAKPGKTAKTAKAAKTSRASRNAKTSKTSRPAASRQPAASGQPAGTSRQPAASRQAADSRQTAASGKTTNAEKAAVSGNAARKRPEPATGAKKQTPKPKQKRKPAEKSRKRYRRGRFSLLYRIFSVAVMVAVVVVALTLFFRVNTIAVEGNDHYSTELIQETTGVQTGDNLILMNKAQIRNTLLEELPWLEEVTIRRRLPATLWIQVQECRETLCVAQSGSLWLFSLSGKIVAREKADSTGGGPRVDGCTLLAPAVGEEMMVEAASESRRTSLFSLAEALVKAGLLEQVQVIHLGDSSMLTMDYADRFTVEMPYGADYDLKLQNLQAVVGKLETNETGRINLRREDRVNFIPD